MLSSEPAMAGITEENRMTAAAIDIMQSARRLAALKHLPDVAVRVIIAAFVLLALVFALSGTAWAGPELGC